MKLAFLISLSLLSVLFTLTNCAKTKKTTATVYVRNTVGALVSGVTVIIHPQSTTQKPSNVDLDSTLVTPASGMVQFDFTRVYKSGQAGAAVMDIYAYKLVGSDTLKAKSYVKLEPEQDNVASIVLK